MPAKPSFAWWMKKDTVYCYRDPAGGCFVGELAHSSSHELHNSEIADITARLNSVLKEGAALARARNRDLHLIDVGEGQLMLVTAECERTPTEGELAAHNEIPLEKLRERLGLAR